MAMLQRLKNLLGSIVDRFTKSAAGAGSQVAEVAKSGTVRALTGFRAARGGLAVLGILGAGGYVIYLYPPMKTLGRGDVGVRTSRLSGEVTEWRDGSVFVLPGLHEMRIFSLRDQTYRPASSTRADGPSPFQSVEGLSLGVDLSVRYALDPAKLRAISASLPENIGGEIVEPAVQSVIYKIFARYTVREIFSTKRAEIQQAIENELKTRLAADGVALRGVLIGKVDLPADYRRGMESLLAEELATEKMRYTLELKDRRVKEKELDALAEKVQREKRAEAAALEQVIAAKGQEEAMKHVLPFKQRQIEQRKLEAEAERTTHLRRAETSAQARKIESTADR